MIFWFEDACSINVYHSAAICVRYPLVNWDNVIQASIRPKHGCTTEGLDGVASIQTDTCKISSKYRVENKIIEI